MLVYAKKKEVEANIVPRVRQEDIPTMDKQITAGIWQREEAAHKADFYLLI